MERGSDFDESRGATRSADSGLIRARPLIALPVTGARNLIHGTQDLSRHHPCRSSHVRLAGVLHAAATTGTILRVTDGCKAGDTCSSCHSVIDPLGGSWFVESLTTRYRCFNPRHGIRVTSGGVTTDLLICFECKEAVVFRDGQRVADWTTGRSPQADFDEALRQAGVPLAEGGE